MPPILRFSLLENGVRRKILGLPSMLFRITPEVWRAIELRVYRGKRADQEHQAKRQAEESSGQELES